MGNHTAVIFPGIELHPDAIYTPIQTNQLHNRPRTKATSKGRFDFAVAIAAAAGPFANVPLLKAKYAKNKLPTKLPAYDATQFFIKSFFVVLPSATAAPTSAVFPVNNSPPDTNVMIKPKGKPKAPKIIFCNPGFSDAIPGHAPPTDKAKYAPNAMWHPATIPSLKISPKLFDAFAAPSATAP